MGSFDIVTKKERVYVHFEEDGSFYSFYSFMINEAVASYH